MSTEFKLMKTWLKNELQTRRFNKVVIGLSGGFDSSLATFVAASEDCLGNENVFGVLMPCESSKDSIEDAEYLALKLDIKYIIHDLKSSFNYFATDCHYMRINNKMPDLTPIELGNIKARMRMITLYAYATPFGGLVLNTSNLSEIMSGNGTKFGDAAGDIALFHNYTKTEMYNLAYDCGFAEMFPKIFNKVPTADLEPNQTDEGTMGVSYRVLDAYLRGSRDLEQKDMERIEKLIKIGAHKRDKMPSFNLQEIVKNEI